MTATPPPHGLRVLLAGASGLIGAHCLELLLADEAIAAVIVLARQPLGRVHPKLRVQVLEERHAPLATRSRAEALRQERRHRRILDAQIRPQLP